MRRSGRPKETTTMATILPAGDSGTFLLLPRNRKREWAKIKIRARAQPKSTIPI